MDLKDFISIRGKGDLFRLVSKTPKGIIVETLNEGRAKFKVQPNLQVLILNDITVFSKDNTDLYLKDVFLKIFEKDGLHISMEQKDDAVKLKEYFKEIAPSHDEEKVYISDIKKIIKWYEIISKFYPDVIEDLTKAEAKTDEIKEEETKETGEAEEIPSETNDLEKPEQA